MTAQILDLAKDLAPGVMQPQLRAGHAYAAIAVSDTSYEAAPINGRYRQVFANILRTTQRKLAAQVCRIIILGLLIAFPLQVAMSDVYSASLETVVTVDRGTNKLPTTDQLATILKHPQLVFVRDADRSVLKMCRCPVSINADEIPAKLRWALVDTEDRHFYAWYHNFGVDPLAIVAAAKAFLLGKRRGGSSLNQQIAKIMVVGDERSFWRKAREFVVAARIERILTKDEIVAVYLNMGDFGSKNGRTIIGIEQAARFYFGKTTRSLNLYEAAVLVGMLNAPTRYNPEKHPEAARQRAELVLSRMLRAGHITTAEAQLALKTGAKPGSFRPVRLDMGYYTAWIMRMVRQQADIIKGNREFRLIISLDSQLQLKAQASIAEMLRMADGRAEQAAFITMNSDGMVRALVGGRDFETNQFDHATMARRPSGSTFKPFVYLRALEVGRKPSDMVLDKPFTHAESLELHVPENWPANFEGRYENRAVPLRQALAMSLNAATARLAMSVGLPSIAETAHKLGIESPLPTDTPSLVLGSSDVVPLELTAAYALFLNGGHRVKPHGIIAILTMDGNIVSEHTAGLGPQVIAPKLADVMADMLHEVIEHGTGWRADFGSWAAGKTGTTQKNQDAWFVGFDRHNALVTTVWIGNDDNRPMQDISGGTLPAQAWRRFYAGLGSSKGIGGPKLVQK